MSESREDFSTFYPSSSSLEAIRRNLQEDNHPPYYSGNRPKRTLSRFGSPVFRRASEGGQPLKRQTQQKNEKEMLRKARQLREERDYWREQDIKRAREKPAQEEKRKGDPR